MDANLPPDSTDLVITHCGTPIYATRNGLPGYKVFRCALEIDGRNTHLNYETFGGIKAAIDVAIAIQKCRLGD